MTQTDDILFALTKLHQLPDCGLEEGDIAALLEEMRKFTEGLIEPGCGEADRIGARFEAGVVTCPPAYKDAYAAWVEGGWQGLAAGEEHGGQGLPFALWTAMSELLATADMAFSLCPLLTCGTIEVLEKYGTPGQSAKWLPELTSGRWNGTMCLTEPQAGSDLSTVRTRAEPLGDGRYALHGQKIYITYGANDIAANTLHFVLARLPDAPPGVKGISLFLVPKYLVGDDGRLGDRNDLTCASIEHKMGIRASATAVMSFGEGPGAIGYLLGEENQGLACMFTMMNHARLNVGLEGVAISERAYQQARGYALERVQGRTLVGDATIAGHPDVRRMLMDMKARTEAQRALAYFAAGWMDRAHGHPEAGPRRQAQSLVDLLIPVVKGWCTEGAQLVTATGVQVHGGMGFIEETGAAQHQRDARITTIYEGTTGIQANDLIGRKLARDGGTAMKGLLAQMRADANAVGHESDALLVDLHASLQRGVQALDEATDGLLGQAPREAAAAAVPYLWLAGTVIGGWLLTRAAVAATAQLDSGSDGEDFLAAKRVTALHFALHVMPHAAAWRDGVLRGAASTLGLTADQL